MESVIRSTEDNAMASVRYFRVQVFQGSRSSPAYFYETEAGLFDLQYGWGKYTRHMHDSLAEAMRDFRQHLQVEHDAADGVQVSLGEPVEVTWEEVRQASPARDIAEPGAAADGGGM
jgi:hypothetical protein